MTAQLSREQLDFVVRSPECYSELEVTMAGMLLAGMDSEPVGTFRKTAVGYVPSHHEDAVPLFAAPPAPVIKCVACDGSGRMHEPGEEPGDCSLCLGTGRIVAPPAPVAVPDEQYQHLSELYHAQEKRLFKLAQRIKGPAFDKYAYSSSQAIDVLEAAVFSASPAQVVPGVMYDPRTATTGSAAMLKPGTLIGEGTKPVTPRYTLPDGWIKCSERMPDETQPVITVAEGGVVQRTVYQFCDGAWVDWYEQYNKVKADAFTHWMPLPAAPEQEV